MRLSAHAQAALLQPERVKKQWGVFHLDDVDRQTDTVGGDSIIGPGGHVEIPLV